MLNTVLFQIPNSYSTLNCIVYSKCTKIRAKCILIQASNYCYSDASSDIVFITLLYLGTQYCNWKLLIITTHILSPFYEH